MAAGRRHSFYARPPRSSDLVGLHGNGYRANRIPTKIILETVSGYRNAGTAKRIRPVPQTERIRNAGEASPNKYRTAPDKNDCGSLAPTFGTKPTTHRTGYRE